VKIYPVQYVSRKKKLYGAYVDAAVPTTCSLIEGIHRNELSS